MAELMPIMTRYAHRSYGVVTHLCDRKESPQHLRRHIKRPCVIVQVAQRHVEAYSRQLGHERSNMRFVTGHIEYLDR